MKSCVAAVICWLAALTASAQTPSNGGPAAVPPAVHASVARIVAPGESSVSYGSGTLVFANDQLGIVITNWHVVNEATQPISVHFPDGFYSTATVARVDRDWDLALLAIRKPNAAPVNVAAAAPRPGATGISTTASRAGKRRERARERAAGTDRTPSKVAPSIALKWHHPQVHFQGP